MEYLTYDFATVDSILLNGTYNKNSPNPIIVPIFVSNGTDVDLEVSTHVEAVTQGNPDEDDL